MALKRSKPTRGVHGGGPSRAEEDARSWGAPPSRSAPSSGVEPCAASPSRRPLLRRSAAVVMTSSRWLLPAWRRDEGRAGAGVGSGLRRRGHVQPSAADLRGLWRSPSWWSRRQEKQGRGVLLRVGGEEGAGGRVSKARRPLSQGSVGGLHPDIPAVVGLLYRAATPGAVARRTRSCCGATRGGPVTSWRRPSIPPHLKGTGARRGFSVRLHPLQGVFLYFFP
jgi:hypothetical protein